MDEKSNEIGGIIFNEFLTKDEFFKLSKAIKRHGKIDEAELEKLVRWAIAMRTGAESVNLLIEGYLSVREWEGENPTFNLAEMSFVFFESSDSILEESMLTEQEKC